MVLATALLAGLAPAAPAQDSVFGIRGLGFVALPVSARSAGMGGGYALFDGGSTLSPVSLAAWRGATGWAVGAGSHRSFDSGAGETTLASTRFPVFGFATPLSSRVVVAVTASDYLNRNWDVVQVDTVTPRDSAVAVSDQTKSLGGVTDIRVAAAYRLSSTVTVGLGAHLLTGSVQTSVRRDFPADSAYRSFVQESHTDYSGVGISLGTFVAAAPRLILGASARVNGRLRAAASADTARVRMPVELNAGLYYAPVEGVIVASTVGYATWGAAAADLQAAGQTASRDVWSVGLGVEVPTLRLGAEALPLRVGYRWRQLPFLVGTSPLSEHALAAGFSFTAAGGRANADLAVEGGTRAAGGLRERFTTVLLGVSILP